MKNRSSEEETSDNQQYRHGLSRPIPSQRITTMPLSSIEYLPEAHATIAIWQMIETDKQMFASFPHLERHRAEAESRFTSATRKMEFLAIRQLLFLVTEGKTCDIGYHASGKPYLINAHPAIGKKTFISISHTKGYACLMLSTEHEVGIDIEIVSNRIEKVASRFLRKDEMAPDIHTKLIHWCAKEAFYKIFSEAHLQANDIRIEPFETSTQGSIAVRNMLSDTMHVMDYRLTDHYVLTYGTGSKNDSSQD